ncbi:MarR family winged helix-turn-helix transcriptional regulator [Priestia megaterium]
MLENSYGFLLSKIAQKMEHSFNLFLQKYEITAREYGILTTLQEESGLSQKKLGEKLRIDRTTVVSLIDHLERLSLVQRVRDFKDRRYYNLVLTEKALKIFKNGKEEVENIENKLLHSLNDEEKAVFKALLTKVFTTI